MQNTSHILMIRPLAFDYNAQTAVNNSFQTASGDVNIHEKALSEFDNFTAKLKQHGIHVLMVEDTKEPHTPDSIFPNNWVSFHEDGTVVCYPMFAENRRMERTKNVLKKILFKFHYARTIDLSHYEEQNLFLEGTGSMVLDREHKIAYACLSPRTNETVLKDFCEHLGYTPVTFKAFDKQRQAVYHTNVMMSIAKEYAVICLDSVPNGVAKNKLTDTLSQTGKTIIPISIEQMQHFAGNMLQVQNNQEDPFIVMSTQAYHSLSRSQIIALQGYNQIIHVPLYAIEKNGGGSARCMMAEVFLPPKR
ncbi:MAG: arginine deiminase-related protein [Niabella sp.]